MLPKRFFVLLILILSAIFLSQTALATTVVSPLLELAVDPGQTQKGLVKIYNETDQDLALTSSVEPFAAADESGKPLYLSVNQDFLQWFEVSVASIVLKPHQAARIPFVVKVPLNATPGGYYAAIFWQTASQPSVDDRVVAVNSKVGTLVLLKVNGDLKESGQVLEFKTQPQNNYFFGLPINFLVRFSNTGNIHLIPEGKIELKNWFGQIETFYLNEGKNNVLPNSTRRFEIVWGKNFEGNFWQNFWSGLNQDFRHLAFGKYTANLELNYGTEQKQTIQKQFSFWIIPWRLIAALLIFIGLIIIFIKINSKMRRLKNKVTP